MLLYQDRVVVPVHDGVEFQAEDPLADGGSLGRDQVCRQGESTGPVTTLTWT